MKFHIGLDYLRLTSDSKKDFLIPPEFPRSEIEGTINDWGMYQYTAHQVITDGFIILWHKGDPDARICAQISGKGWAKFRLLGLDQMEILRYYAQTKARGTRLDIALDVDLALDPSDLKKHFDQGLIKTRARSCTIVESNKGLGNEQTCYLGSLSSESCLRIYDKSAQLGAGIGALYRLEIVFSGKRADLALKALGDDNSLDPATSLQALYLGELRKMIKETSLWWLLTVFERLEGVGTIELIRPRKDTDSDLFITKTVIPFLNRKGHLVSDSILNELELALTDAQNRSKTE